MTIKIGGKDYRTKTPTDLDAKLLASTGLSVSEVAIALCGSPLPHLVARALKPFLPEDAPTVVELSSLIAAEGVVGVARSVAGLFKSDDSKASADGATTGQAAA